MINASGFVAPSIGASPIPQAPNPVGVPAAPLTPAVTAPVFAQPAVTPPPASPQASAQTPTGSSFSPAKKKLPIRLIIGAVVLTLLLIGGIAAYFLSQISQDVRQQASEGPYVDLCTFTGDTKCVNGLLYSCPAPGSTFSVSEKDSQGNPKTCSNTQSPIPLSTPTTSIESPIVQSSPYPQSSTDEKPTPVAPKVETPTGGTITPILQGSPSPQATSKPGMRTVFRAT